jgi:hypothetical protein
MTVSTFLAHLNIPIMEFKWLVEYFWSPDKHISMESTKYFNTRYVIELLSTRRFILNKAFNLLILKMAIIIL